ncbi:MAG: hypothetical protein GWN00_01190 [Aliifodinibius sp.]|nr:hypothetical protein [Fodinibius sp.]NIV09946.1 hypothetical protein [Fodinibius sp.]NIY23476.1 hypothetical protein [Fodinibius sp.]
MDFLAHFQGRKFTDIEKILLNSIVGETNHFEWPALECTHPQAKWVVTSALQKAIRRGQVEDARDYASALFDKEASYIVRRLAVIALEDVSVANIKAVAYALALVGKIKWIRANGGHSLFSWVAGNLASGETSRIACDIACIGGLDPKLQPEIKSWAGSYDSELLEEVFTSNSYTIGERHLAGLALIGALHTKENGKVIYSTKNEEVFDKCLDRMEVPTLIRYLVYKGRKANAEGLFVGLILAWQRLKGLESAEDDESPELEPEDLLGYGYLGGVVSSAYDMHTAVGKKAIRLFAKEVPEIKDFLRKNKFTERFLFSAIFNTEGTALRKPFDNIVTRNFETLNRHINITRFNTDEATLSEMYGLVIQNLTRLNDIRERLLNDPVTE